MHVRLLTDYANPSSLLVTVMGKGKKKNNPNSPAAQAFFHTITTRSSVATQSSSKSDPPASKVAPQPATSSVDPAPTRLPPAPAPLFDGYKITSPAQKFPNIQHLVQSLPPDLHVFLEADLDGRMSKVTKPLIYQTLIHFNPWTMHRITSTKPVLYKAFKDDVLPLILPFQIPSPPAPMQTDQYTKDFNPLGRKTTQKMRHNAILERAPTTEIPANARLDGLRLLYQAHVDPDLVIPGQTKYI